MRFCKRALKLFFLILKRPAMVPMRFSLFACCGCAAVISTVSLWSSSSAVGARQDVYQLSASGAEFDKEKAKEIEERVERKPLIVFTVKGDRDACGEMCSQWIAVEGSFDKQAAQRFKDFLVGLNRYDLPVFFNSPGGLLSEAVSVAQFLREHRMTTAVGRTIPAECKPTVPISNACRELMKQPGEQEATLLYEKASCASACVMAILGGSTRRVNAATNLLVHSGYSLSEDRDIDYDSLKRFVIAMGINPGLIDAAMAIPFEQRRALSREEIKNFGIETRGFYETPWLFMRGVPKMPKGITIAKSITFPAVGDSSVFESRVISFSCGPTQGPQSVLIYEMLLPINYKGGPPQVLIRFGQQTYLLRMIGSAPNRVIKALGLSFEKSGEIARMFTLHFDDDRRSVDVDTSGLTQKMNELRSACEVGASPFRYPPTVPH